MSKTRESLLSLLKYQHGFALEVPFRGLSGKRRFRFDAAREDIKLACEYQGIGKGHQWHGEQVTDHEKLSEAQLLGWRVILCDAASVNSGKCVEYVEAALRQQEGTA